MQRMAIEAPREAVEGGAGEGFWYRCTNGQATATLRWFGGPKSPDPDVMLWDMEAAIPGMGAGTMLLREIEAWVDSRMIPLALHAVVAPARVEWLAREGFQFVKRVGDDVVMVRPAKPVPILRHN